MTNGKAYFIFKINGVPKIIGSLMLNIPGPNDIFASSRSGLFLEKIKIATIKPSVAPEPPA